MLLACRYDVSRLEAAPSNTVSAPQATACSGFFSFQLGLVKPDPRVFDRICEAARVPKSASLMVGDSVRTALQTSERGGGGRINFTKISLRLWHERWRSDFNGSQAAGVAKQVLLDPRGQRSVFEVSMSVLRLGSQLNRTERIGKLHWPAQILTVDLYQVSTPTFTQESSGCQSCSTCCLPCKRQKGTRHFAYDMCSTSRDDLTSHTSRACIEGFPLVFA